MTQNLTDYCGTCGAATRREIPEGDNRERDVCSQCGTIHYKNPNIVAGCIVEHEGKILLCKRAIEPRHGFWTIPAGFMENNETVQDAAARESWEEALAKVRIDELYGVYNIHYVSQIYMIFRASLPDGQFGVGSESLETKLVDPADIPWDDLAFRVVEMALKRYLAERETGDFRPFVDDVYRRV